MTRCQHLHCQGLVSAEIAGEGQSQIISFDTGRVYIGDRQIRDGRHQFEVRSIQILPVAESGVVQTQIDPRIVQIGFG